jgi:hypothetical protein
MEGRRMKENEKQMKSDSITKHCFPLRNYSNIVVKVNGKKKPQAERSLCVLF